MSKALAFIALLSALAFTPDSVHAQTIGGHAAFARYAEENGLPPARAPRLPTIPLHSSGKSLSVEILGFLPYWSSADPEDLRYDLLTTVAYFGASINEFGAFTDLHGWPDGTLIDAAHDNGVRVVLTVTCFNSTTINLLLSSTNNRATAVTNIVDQVTTPGADGVNIDFEGLPYARKADFVAFIEELRDALADALPDPYLTVDTPAVDWSGAFDYDRLAAAADHLFIMAYDYHYSGGNPGPVSPLYGSTTWGQYAIDWTLDDYDTYLTPYTLQNVLLGLPLYGFDWPSTDDSVPGAQRDDGDAVFLEEAVLMSEDPDTGPRLYDAGSDTPYLVYSVSGDGWHQVWYDDAESLSLRFEYSKLRATGGIGFWALGYEGAGNGLWESVVESFSIPDDDTADDTSSDDTASDDTIGDDTGSDDISPDDSLDDSSSDDVGDDTFTDDSSDDDSAFSDDSDDINDDDSDGHSDDETDDATESSSPDSSHSVGKECCG